MNLKKSLRSFLGITNLNQQNEMLNNEIKDIKSYFLDDKMPPMEMLNGILAACDNYCNPHSYSGNYQDAINIQNSVVGHQTLLCASYSSFIRDIFRLNKLCQLWWKRLPHGSYYHFITNQKELDFISRYLDEESSKILYFLLFLKVTMPLIVSGDHGAAYSHEQHGRALKYINEIIPNPWDMSSEKLHNSTREQYILDEAPIEKGMYVIDGGAFDGDTAVFFSELVGSEGKVFSFEPGRDAFTRLTGRRLPNVVCINKGLYSSERVIFFQENPDALAASCVTEASEHSIEVTSIDAFVESNNIPKIDFIKMDIEGSEMAALSGARQTIERFLPILVICLYHNGGDDYIDVPYHLTSLYGDRYEFHIKQNSIIWDEAIILCIPKK